jgi:hypothetical protein
VSDRFDRQLFWRTGFIVSSVLAIVLAWFGAFHRGYSLDDQAKSVGILKDLLEISALLIGSLWTIRIYVVSRTEREAVSVEQIVKTLALPDGRYLLRVLVTLRNIGKVKVELKAWRLRADLVLPLVASLPASKVIAERSAFSEHTAQWMWLTNPEEGTFSGEKFQITLEPGESELQIGNLVVPKWAEVVQIYSHFERRATGRLDRTALSRSSPEGWSQRTMVDVKVELIQKETTDDRP